MGDNIDLKDKISRYIKNEVDQSEKKELLNHIRNEPSARTLYEESIAEIVSMEVLMEQYTRKLLKSSTVEITRNKRDTLKSILLILLIVIIGGLIWYFSTTGGKNTATHEAIFAEYFYQDDGLPMKMGEDPVLQEFYKGMAYYKNHDYKMAFVIWGIIKSKPISDTVSFYTAMSHIYLNHWDQGISILKSIPETSEFQDKASYFLALYDVKHNNIEDAIKKLQSNNHPYANDLRNELEGS